MKDGLVIKNKILTIRGVQVMFDSDLAIFYEIEIKEFNLSHDRFLIIHDIVYHIGASLKDTVKIVTQFFGTILTS